MFFPLPIKIHDNLLQIFSKLNQQKTALKHFT